MRNKDTRKKNCLECGVLNLECGLPFTIHIHDEASNSNGFGIQHLGK